VPVVVDRVVLSPQFGSNCYLARASEEAGEAVAIDPGGEPGPVVAELGRLGANLAGILVTHTDVDHVAGLGALAAATGAEAWVPAREAEFVRTGMTRSGPVAAHDPAHLVEDGDSLELAGIQFDVVAVPGHSVDHVAFCVEGKLFAGDLLFHGSVGRVDFPGGDWERLLASIGRLLDRFGPDAVVYPGHGEPTTLGRELTSNPFLGELRAAR
jgi:hydroxyacylglutathione hydrolase